MLFSPLKKGRSWVDLRHEIGIKRLSGKRNHAGLAVISSCRVIIHPGRLLHPIPPQQHLWQEVPDPTPRGVWACPNPAGLQVALLPFFTAALEHGQDLVVGLGAALAGWGHLAPWWTTHQRTGMSPASPLSLPQL